MIATKSHSLFTPEPHYIPGYAGFYPQLRYQVGYTYGRTTAQVLTDPTVNKSPCSVLAPLTKPKFIEDFSQNKTSHAQHMDANQPYIPHHTGFQPFKDSEVKGHYPPLGTEQHGTEQNGTPVPECNQCMLSTGKGTETMPYPPHPPCPSCEKAKEPDFGHPGLRLAYGKEGWKTSPSLDKPPVCPQLHHFRRDVHPPLPSQTETLDVGRFERLPKLDKPDLIQHKAISGYAGFVPRFTWVMGMNYRDGVQQAMDEFDKSQALQHLTPSGTWCPLTMGPKHHSIVLPFGRTVRFQPDKHQHTAAKMALRETYGLTFGSSTRKAYRKEQKRRNNAL